MSLADIKTLFEKTLSLLKYRGDKDVKFIWHGGEPLTIEPSYYESIWDIQKTVFNKSRITYSNSIQTNLTLLTDTYLKKMRGGIFDSIGVSYDMIGDHRVNVAGKQVKEKVFENMQKLIDNDIPFGIITVLTNEVAKHAEKIFTWFDEREISISFLPLFQPSGGSQPLKESINEKKIVSTYKKLFDRWLNSDNATSLLPLDYYMDDVIAEIKSPDSGRQYYDRFTDEWIWVINTDGNVYPYDDEYSPGLIYGNIFTDTIESIFHSPNRKRIAAISKDRIQQVCSSCNHFGHCSGYYVGDSIYPSFDKDHKMICGIVKPTLDYMYERMAKEQLITADTI